MYIQVSVHLLIMCRTESLKRQLHTAGSTDYDGRSVNVRGKHQTCIDVIAAKLTFDFRDFTVNTLTTSHTSSYIHHIESL